MPETGLPETGLPETGLPETGLPETGLLQIRTVGFDDPDAVTLINAVQRVYVERYGDVDLTPVAPPEFAPPSGLFMVGYVDGRPVVCGGWRLRRAGSDPQLRDGDVELKRMYVADGHRGRGYARLLLAELERAARDAGGLRIVLETGTLQPEAVALYGSSGYEAMPRFGVYRDSEESLCFAKPLS